VTTATTPDVPIPAGAKCVDDWQGDAPMPYRLLFGELRNIDGGTNYTTVQTTAVQFADGRIDDGRMHEPAARLPWRRLPHQRAGPRTRRPAHRGSRRGGQVGTAMTVDNRDARVAAVMRDTVSRDHLPGEKKMISPSEFLGPGGQCHADRPSNPN
jgi:hypothetical protein